MYSVFFYGVKSICSFDPLKIAFDYSNPITLKQGHTINPRGNNNLTLNTKTNIKTIIKGKYLNLILKFD